MAHYVSRRGCDRIVVVFTTTDVISTYHHWCCELESRSGRGVQHYVIKCVSDLRKFGGFFPGPPVSSTNRGGCHDIAEILLKVALTTITQTKKTICVMRKKLPILLCFQMIGANNSTFLHYCFLYLWSGCQILMNIPVIAFYEMPIDI
jgi:hypothetical protein